MLEQRKTPAGGRGSKYGSGKGLKHWLTNASGVIVDEYLDLHQSDFTPFEVILLRFVKTRTLRWGKQAERIPFRHFVDGVVTDDGVRICSGLPMSSSTIRKALYSLIQKGWIIRRASERQDGGDDAHEYSLDMDKFKQIDNIEELEDRTIKAAAAIQVNEMTLIDYLNLPERTAKTHAKAVDAQVSILMNHRDAIILEPEMHLKLPKNSGSTRVRHAERGGYATHRPNSNYSVITVEKEEKETIVSSSTASRPRARVNRAFEIDCKPREGESAKQMVQRLTEQHRAARAAKVGTATSVISKAQIQAILDRLLLEESAGLPRTLVTDKAYGLIKKRAKEQQLSDIREFLRFVVMHWSDLAHRYNYGLRQARKAGTTTSTQDMLPSPDAWTIATKFTWFARHFSAHQAGVYENMIKKIAESREAELQREVDRLTRHNRQLVQEKGKVEQLARRHAQRAQAASATTARRSVLGQDTRYQDDEE